MMETAKQLNDGAVAVLQQQEKDWSETMDRGAQLLEFAAASIQSEMTTGTAQRCFGVDVCPTSEPVL